MKTTRKKKKQTKAILDLVLLDPLGKKLFKFKAVSENVSYKTETINVHETNSYREYTFQTTIYVGDQWITIHGGKRIIPKIAHCA